EAGSDEVAEVEAAGESAMHGLLRELATASLAESVRLLPQLEAEGGLTMPGLFEAMRAGALNYDAQTQRYWRLSEGADAVDVLSGATLPAAELQDTTRIRLNNRLRTMLRQSIARINLTEGSARQRRGAALSMLSGIDADSVVLLREALQQEEDAAVRELLDLGIALFTVTTSTDEEEALQALGHMEGRLETPVRNTLTRIIESRAEDMPQLAESASRVLRGIEGDMRFYQRIEQLFFGLSLGSVLLLAATGLAVTFGVMGVINMAHGEMLMLGAYTTYVVQLLMPGHINLSLWVALPAA